MLSGEYITSLLFLLSNHKQSQLYFAAKSLSTNFAPNLKRNHIGIFVLKRKLVTHIGNLVLMKMTLLLNFSFFFYVVDML